MTEYLQKLKKGYDMTRMIERILAVLGIVILLVTTIFLAIKFSSITGEVPTHFNAAGEADEYGSKFSLLVPIILGWVIYITDLILLKFPKAWNVPRGWAYGPIKMMVVVLNVFIAISFSWMTIASVQGEGLGPGFIIITLGGVFGTIIAGCVFSFLKRC